jgi:hypothetical protein
MNGRHRPRRISPLLLRQIREFTAYDSVGVTALRGQARGTRATAIDYLKKIDLSTIPRRKVQFGRWLNDHTQHLRGELPLSQANSERLWGVARKALNLFLRGCLYNHYLRDRYRLANIETLLEVPLDSRVAGELIDQGNCSTPWRGLKKLTPAQSESFQKCSGELAGRKKLQSVVFLDHTLWLPK